MKPAKRLGLIAVFGVVGIIGAYFFREWRLDRHFGPMPTEWVSNVKAEFKSDGSLKDYSATSKLGVMPDWSQFLGPRRDGALPGVKMGKEWPKDGPKVLWTVKVGEGFGGAAIRDGEVYLADRQDDEKDVMRCFKLDTGEELWSATEFVKGRVNYNGSRSVPCVTEKHVLSSNLMGWVYAFSRKDHKTVWRKNLAQEYSASMGGFGFAQSPLLYKGTVIFAPCSKKAGLIALKEGSGEEFWKSEPISGSGYVTPILASVNGEDQVLILTNGGLHALNPENGKKLWEYKDYYCSTPIPAPTVLSDGRIFITGGYKAGSTMLSVKKEGGSYVIKELFRIEYRGSQIHPAIYYKNHLYANFNFNANIKRRPDGLICMDLNGKLKWQTKKDPHIGRGNLILLGDCILTLGGDDGVLRLVEANSEKYVELGQFQALSGKQMWAPMAYSQGKLVLRSQKEMKCLVLNP